MGERRRPSYHGDGEITIVGVDNDLTFLRSLNIVVEVGVEFDGNGVAGDDTAHVSVIIVGVQPSGVVHQFEIA